MFTSLTEIGRLLERRARYRSYRATKSALEGLSDADLLDIGAKRYQIDSLARQQSLK